ncbi:MAG: hypothetical protein MUF10_02115 [Thermoanaerobaculaceae bacterium]|jgi:hypothetical protein|nr:hypothetical protein [Thermoanaerobaculaceae bacterium]
MVARVTGMAALALLAAMAAWAEPPKDVYCNGRPKIFKGLRMYPNGRPIQIGEIYLYPNSRPTQDEDDSLLYANGRRLVENGFALYPNGRFMYAEGVSYYPNRIFLFKDGVFHDRKGNPVKEPVSTVSLKLKGFIYDFAVVDRVPSQNRIRVSFVDTVVMTSFTLDKGVISDVTAECAPGAFPTPED